MDPWQAQNTSDPAALTDALICRGRGYRDGHGRDVGHAVSSVNRVATVEPLLTDRSDKNQDQTKDQRRQILPDRARRPQTSKPL